MSQEVKALLREKGIKVTTQRVLVLSVLMSNPEKHFTAEEIYELVKSSYPEIGLATVYRTIQLLSENQLVDRISLDDGLARYGIGNMGDATKHHHHHLISDNKLHYNRTSCSYYMQFHILFRLF